MEESRLQTLKNRYDIIGNDAALNRALETAVAVAPTDLTVLVTGESGVGKDNIPRIIHQYSRRKNARFLSLNCAAIPQGTIASELFGHVKGSFTGAVENRKGYFEEANGGTLFLDEVGELPLEYQAQLLRVIQSGEFLKVGSSKVEKTDVRVIVATNNNLQWQIAKGKFREDLYYRISGINITMPSLRERKNDIYLLFRKFSSDMSEKYGMRTISLTHDGIEALQSYRWPGNIRQLKNFTEAVTTMENINPSSRNFELNAAALLKYLPAEESNLPVSFNPSAQESEMSSSDREMLVKAILNLKQDVESLKSVVYGSGTPMLTHPEAAPAHMPASSSRIPQDEPEWQHQVPDEQIPSEPENLSLKDAEEDRIRKALEKYGGNRKQAAAELGISERTLYRRLKGDQK